MSNAVAVLSPLSEAEVQDFVADWYRQLDVHAPLVAVLEMLADEGLEMRFPEATARGHSGFTDWYERVTRLFFDEVHELKEVHVELGHDKADVQLVVKWQAHVWNPPAPRSQWLGFDAAQRWVVQRSAVTGKPVIVTYIVDALTPWPGSASL